MPNSLATIKTSTTIHARPAGVFRVLSDFSKYEKWNPWVTKAQGQCAVGAEVVTKHNHFGTVKHQLTEVIAPEKMRWELSGWQRYFVKASREVLIFPGIDNNTLVTMKVTIRGPILFVVMLVFRRALKKAMSAEIKSLKLYCETIASEKSSN